MCFLALLLWKVGFEPFTVQSEGFTRLLQALLNSDSHGNGHTDHGVVASAQEAYHFDMGGDGGGAGELGIGVHTAHGVGHADHGVVAGYRSPPEASFRRGILP